MDIKRPIQIPWSCDKRGTCCRTTPVVVMTTQEAAEIAKAVPAETLASLLWYRSNDGFCGLKAAPCPLLTDDGLCSVYEVRPYNCRRFACYRVGDEAWEQNPDGSCKNMTDRLQESRAVRRDATLRQRKAQRWARSHGWTEE